MCLAVPARVEEVRGDQPEFLCGIVDFGGVRREVSLAFTPAARPGDYVLVHAGFALEVVDEQEAATRLAALRALGLDDEAAP
jgi:hydrogenase expression/formation protein HypC